MNGPSGTRHSSLPLGPYAINPSSLKNANTFFPSLTGLGDAPSLALYICICRARTTSRRQMIFPVLRSRAKVLSLSPSVAVMNTRSTVTTGDDRANGSAVLQTRFLFGPNSAGNVTPSATPVPFGPRNCSHSRVSEVFAFCAYATEAQPPMNSTTVTRVTYEKGFGLFMFVTLILSRVYFSGSELALVVCRVDCESETPTVSMRANSNSKLRI